jgi:phytoene synthase
VRRHAAAGRVYIPEDELQAAGVDRETLAGGNSDERTRRLFAEQAERARRFFDSAMERLPAADRRQQRPGVVLASLYASLLDEMARDGYPLLERRYHLTPLRKLWLAWRATKRPGRRKSANQTETPQ